MKAAIKLLILAMACVFLCTQGIAISETSPTVPPLRHILDISLSVSPDELVNPGEVTLTFAISNASEFTASNLYMESAVGHHSESLGQLLPGESQTYTRTYTVTEEELAAGKLCFIISHDDIIAGEGESVVYNVETLLTRAEATADIEFTRQFSSAYVTADTAVILTYRVYNSGNVPLENVRVQDSLGNFTGVAESLSPGETKIFSNRINVTTDVNSRASVSYAASAAGIENRTVELEKASIAVVEPAVSVGLTLDRQEAKPGDTINGVITIAAEGTDIKGITVFDDVNNVVIADTLEVRAGESLTITCSWPVRNVSEYRVRVEGTDAAGGAAVGYSDAAAIKLSTEFATNELGITANAQSTALNRKGKARISLAITNDGTAAARDMVLSEATLGEICTFEFIPAGEPTVKSVLVDVEDDSEFIFTLAGVSADGSEVYIQTEPVKIVISSDGDDPVPEETEAEGSVYHIRNASTYYWMIGAGALVLLVLVILLIVSHDRERRDRKLRRQNGAKRRRVENPRQRRNNQGAQ